MGEAYLAFAEEEPGYYAAIFEVRGQAAPAPAPERPNPFDLLVEALRTTFPDGFDGVDPRFLALEVWALSHGIATLSAAGQLPKPGPDKYESLCPSPARRRRGLARERRRAAIRTCPARASAAGRQPIADRGRQNPG
jgi:hypothetical protein